MKLRSIGIALLAAGALALAAPSARAEGEEGGGGDLKERIKKKMERILELMKKNEEALIVLSTGEAAETKRVDVPVPEGQPSGKSGDSGEGAGEGGKKAAEELGRLAERSRKEGGAIPGELRELVEMIPL
jgi:hypothetical protein